MGAGPCRRRRGLEQLMSFEQAIARYQAGDRVAAKTAAEKLLKTSQQSDALHLDLTDFLYQS